MSSEGAPSPARLARKAAELVEQCNYDLACKFLTRALETSPSDPTLLDALADVYLQLGNVEAAGMLLDKSARVAPDAGAAKWLLPRAAAAGRRSRRVLPARRCDLE